jgi:Ribbon-helix-helix protein, copG family
MEKTTLYLLADLRALLKEAARRTGRPEAEIVREALRSYLQQHGRPSPRSLGLGENAELSGRESEAWLKAHWRPE